MTMGRPMDVDDHAQVQLAVHLQLLLDQYALDELALGAGLVGDELHTEDLVRGRAGLVRRVGELDATALATASGVDLRLYDNGSGQLHRDCLGLVSCRGYATLGDGNT
jgi:hypothetical protein